MDTIQVSLSEAFTGKQLKPGKPESAHGYSFVATPVTPQRLYEHITKGERWAVGIYKGNHRARTDFISSQVLALDCDKGPSVEEIDRQSKLPTIIHPTASSTETQPRTRVIFILEHPITDLNRWELVQKACFHNYRAWDMDDAQTHGAAPFYGSTVPGGKLYPERRITQKVLDAWITVYNDYLDEELEKTRLDAPLTPSTGTAPELPEKLIADVSAALGVNTRETNSAGFIRQMVRCPIASHENDNTAPAMHWHPTKYFAHCFKCGKDYTTHQLAEALGIDTKPYYRTTEPGAPPMPPPPVLNIQVVTGEEASQRAAKTFEERLMNPQAIIGMKSDITALDYALGGFAPGGVYTFLGETGTGKTTLCASLAYKFAAQGKGIIVSAENSAEAFIDKMVAYATELHYGDIRRGCKLVWKEVGALGDTRPETEKFTPNEVKLIDAARERITDYIKGTVFVASGSPSPAILRSVFADYGQAAQWAILDSLNNIRISGAGEYENMTDAALLAEELAVDYNLSVVATAQGGRNTKERKNKQLTLHDAVGSNHVENKGHAVISIYDQWRLLDEEVITQSDIDESYPRGQVKLRILKLRDGNPGKPLAVKYIGGCGFYSVKK